MCPPRTKRQRCRLECIIPETMCHGSDTRPHRQSVRETCKAGVCNANRTFVVSNCWRVRASLNGLGISRACGRYLRRRPRCRAAVS